MTSSDENDLRLIAPDYPYKTYLQPTNRLPSLGQEVEAINSISLLCICSGLEFFVQRLFYTFISVRCWAESSAKDGNPKMIIGKLKIQKNKKSGGFLLLIFRVLVISVISQLASCTQHKIENVERAFYYWKSNSSFSDKEKKMCDSLGVKKLYIKFFEVNNNEERGNFPESKIDWRWRYSKNDGFNEVIPTVYLRNVVFLKSSEEDLDILAENVNFLINKYLKEGFQQNVVMKEFQMDCDWTLKTKDNYFYFLQKLKSISAKQISCTLRLYPYKYPDKMGVPPVDKATLMCYNLLNPLENPNKNSILDLSELKSYLNVGKKYPKHLDIALPVYSWAQVYHNERFSEVLYTNWKSLKNILKSEKPLWYSVTQDTVINNTYLRLGDKIKYEIIDADKIKDAITLLKKNIDFDNNTTVALFHLDEEQLNNYTNEELSSFYTDFGK